MTSYSFPIFIIKHRTTVRSSNAWCVAMPVFRHVAAWTVLSKWRHACGILPELIWGQNRIDKVVTLVKKHSIAKIYQDWWPGRLCVFKVFFSPPSNCLRGRFDRIWGRIARHPRVIWGLNHKNALQLCCWNSFQFNQAQYWQKIMYNLCCSWALW